MILNEYGQIAQTEWVRSAEIRKEIKIDKFVIMPNHLHAIMAIDNHHPVGPYGHTAESNTSENHTQKDPRTYCHTSLQSPSKNVGAMIRGFKSSVTTKINILRNTPQTPVWQAQYYDHIISNRQEYHKIFNYIVNNPAKWQEDKYYI